MSLDTTVFHAEGRPCGEHAGIGAVAIAPRDVSCVGCLDAIDRAAVNADPVAQVRKESFDRLRERLETAGGNPNQFPPIDLSQSATHLVYDSDWFDPGPVIAAQAEFNPQEPVKNGAIDNRPLSEALRVPEDEIPEDEIPEFDYREDCRACRELIAHTRHVLDMTDRERISAQTYEANPQPDLRTLEGQLQYLDYHAPDNDQRVRHIGVNQAIQATWRRLAPLLDDGPGKTRALHALNHARMEMNNCIANHGA